MGENADTLRVRHEIRHAMWRRWKRDRRITSVLIWLGIPLFVVGGLVLLLGLLSLRAWPMQLFGLALMTPLAVGVVFNFRVGNSRAALRLATDRLRCVSCGYDLSVVRMGDVCPECGWDVDAEGRGDG